MEIMTFDEFPRGGARIGAQTGYRFEWVPLKSSCAARIQIYIDICESEMQIEAKRGAFQAAK